MGTLLRAVFLILLAGAASAKDICSASDEDLAQNLSGTWTATIVGSMVRNRDVVVPGPYGSVETVIIFLSPDQIGTLTIKGVDLPLRRLSLDERLAQTTDSKWQGALHMSMTMAAVSAGCPEGKSVPIYAANSPLGSAVYNRIDLTVTSTTKISAAQSTTLPALTGTSEPTVVYSMLELTRTDY